MHATYVRVVEADDDWDHPDQMAAVDAERLTKSLERLTANPHEWGQGSWVRHYVDCGTTACLAGTTVQMAGYEIDWDRGSEIECDGSVVASFTTTGVSIEALARELLGLSAGAAEYLFHYYLHDIGELWRRAAQVTGGRVAVPAEFAP